MKLDERWLKVISSKVDEKLKSGGIIDPDQLSVLMSRCFRGEKRFNIKILTTTKPFIMSIYPNIHEISDDKNPIFKKTKNTSEDSTFTSINNWDVEIDKRLFTDSKFKCISGDEFVALLCHELGHVVLTNPISVILRYRLNKAKFKMFEKLMMSNQVIQKLCVPMIVATSNFRIITSHNVVTNTLAEVSADLKVPNQYKQSLVDYIDRCILYNPEVRNSIIMTQGEYEAEIDKSVEFSKECIDLFRFRKDTLCRAIENQRKMSESPYIQGMCSLLMKCVDGQKDDESDDLIIRYKIYEDYKNAYADTQKEATSVLEMLNVKERDIYALRIGVEKIKTPDDKLYMLETIYDYIESLEKQVSKMNKKEGSPKTRQEKWIDELTELRDQVMAKQVYNGPKHYGLFVQYPEGYEG